MALLDIQASLSLPSISVFALAFAGLVILALRTTDAPHRVKLPGPRGVPLFGSIFAFRQGHARALEYWAQKYGCIIRVEALQIFLNTYAAVQQTLIQQGAAFQSRPEFRIWHNTFAVATDPEAPSTVGTQTSAAKLPCFNHFAAHRYFRLVRLLADASQRKTATDLGYPLWTTTIGISADILFGTKHDDKMTETIADANIKAFRIRTIGQPLHDYVPVVAVAEKIVIALSKPLRPLLGMPDWVKSLYAAEAHAEEIRRVEVSYCTKLLAELHDRLDKGDSTPSQLGDIFRTLPEPLPFNEELRLAETLAGSGMSSGTGLTWLAGLLAVSPDLQDRAYAAIDEVYGGLPPDPLDTDRVEYIKALGMEAGRYFTSIRLGFPRETYEDTIVDGILVPQGTLVIYNSFQINRDADRYDFPDQFIPERWMDGHYGRTDCKSAKVGVPHLNHGAGRRMCMGVPNVNCMFYGTLSLLLYFFKLERGPMDDNTKAEVFPRFRAESEAGLAMHPIDDQISVCDAQALSKCAGIKLIPRDIDALHTWLSSGHREMDQWERPNSTDAALAADIDDLLCAVC